jgi:hypothetical protein
MGIFKKDELLLDFKGVQTEDMSSTIPYMNKLNADAKMLVNQLNPNDAINRKGLVLFNESEQYDLYKLFEKSNTLNNNDNNFSETSPFISSDVYNQLLDKLKNKQSGGAKTKQSRSRNEDKDDDFEEESSTTSSEESDSDKKNKKIKKMFKKESEDNEIDLEEEDEEEMSEMSAGSYISSSAHTDGSDDEKNTNTQTATSSFTSTVSVKNHRNRHHNMSDSVNTSDINIISVE